MYQSTTDVLIENNMILNNAANGIELFISGERIVILGNTIAGNTKNGVYIKRDSTTDSNWETAKQLLISANIIQGNSENGIEIETTSDFRPYMMNISSNDIFGNSGYGINCYGMYVDIVNNNIFGNAVGTSAHYYGVRIYGADGVPSKYINIANNLITNNGAASKSANIGLVIMDYVEYVNITGNIITTDTALPTANQNYGLWVEDNTTEIVLKNNKINGHAGANLIVANGADVKGERVVCKIGSINAANSAEHPIFSPASNMCLISAAFINAASVTGSASQYETLTILNKGTGTSSNTVCGVNPQSLTAFTTTDLGTPNATYKYLSENETLCFGKAPTGGGLGLTHAVVILNYVTY